jgi:hypothetical protein
MVRILPNAHGGRPKVINVVIWLIQSIDAIWYICAMMLKDLAVLAIVLAIPQAQLTASGQTDSHTSANRPAAASAPSTSAPLTATPAPAVTPDVRTDCPGGNCDYQPSHITVATPAPAPSPWPLQDRLKWGTEVVLVLLGYGGIMVALSTLRKIERQSSYSEAAAQAAAESSQAALAYAQAILHAERPWVLVTIVPSRNIENGFTVIATNRGRSPAQIVSAAEGTSIVADEANLPAAPEFAPGEPDNSLASIILLPGEFMNLKSFSRDDVRGLCETEERLLRVENWEERIFLYGKVVYRDLMGPADHQTHETGWCCRYIHGRQKSGLVMAGPQEYNLHT